MNRRQQLLRIDALKQSAAWEYDPALGLYSAAVDDYTIEVQKVVHPGDGSTALERGNVNATWTVRHERFGTLIAPTPSSVALYAKREALDYVRAHILQQPEPTHA
jgi:hypothetical protein